MVDTILMVSHIWIVGVTGEPVRNVSTDAVSVMGSRAINGQLNKLFPDTSKPNLQTNW